MGRPGCGCCGDCACIYKVNKDNGNIEWTKNLGVNATAVAVFKDKIYVAVDNAGYDMATVELDSKSLAGPEFLSLYDIVVLDKSGKILFDECLSFLPKIVLPDEHNGENPTDKNLDTYVEIINNSNYPTISYIYIYEDNNYNICINVILNDKILKIVNGLIDTILDCQSYDHYLYNNNLVFMCNEIPYENAPSIRGGFKYEFGDDFIKVSKYKTLFDKFRDNKLNPETYDMSGDLIALRYIPKINAYRYDSLSTIINLGSQYSYLNYTIEKDKNEEYYIYRFNINIRNIIFLRMTGQSNAVTHNKVFHSADSVTSNGYHNLGLLTELPESFGAANLEEHAKVLLGSAKPSPPNMYRCILDLNSYTYSYQIYKSLNNSDNILKMIDTNEISGRKVKLNIQCFSKYPGGKTGYNKAHYEVFRPYDGAMFWPVPDSPVAFWQYYLYDGNPIFNHSLAYPYDYMSIFKDKDYLGELVVMDSPVSVEIVNLSKIKDFILEIDNSVSCGYFEELTQIVFSYKLRRKTISHTKGPPGVYSESFTIDENFSGREYGMGHAFLEALKSSGDYAKCKLVGINFKQISKSYNDSNGNKVFNAIMVGNWAIYQNIYSLDIDISPGNGIEHFTYTRMPYIESWGQGPGYLYDAFVYPDKNGVATVVLLDGSQYQWYWDNHILNSPYFHFIDNPAGGYPAGYYSGRYENGKFIFSGLYFSDPSDSQFTGFVDRQAYAKELVFTGLTEEILTTIYNVDMTTNIYGNKLAPYQYIHTNTKVLIRLNESNGTYSIEKNDLIDHSLYDYTNDAEFGYYNAYKKVSFENDCLRLDRFCSGDLRDSDDRSNIDASLPSQNMNKFAYNRDISPKSINPRYSKTGPAESGNIPIIINDTWPDKYDYRGYVYDVTNSLTRPGYSDKNTAGGNYFIRRSKFNSTLMNDNSSYRLSTYDNRSEYMTFDSLDGQKKGRFDTSSYFGGTNINDVHVLFYNYQWSTQGYLTIGYHTGHDYVYKDFDIYTNKCSDIVNFINSYGVRCSPINDDFIYKGNVIIKTNGYIKNLGGLIVKFFPYEKEKYNIFKFTDGELKWKSNFLMQPRIYTEFVDRSGDYNSYTYQDVVYPTDITMDDSHLYITSLKRKNSPRSIDNNMMDVSMSNSRTNPYGCGEIGDRDLEKIIDYTMKDLKSEQ